MNTQATPLPPLIGDRRTIPEKRWWAMCDAKMPEPETLDAADVTHSFVYSRRYGFFQVPFGQHQVVMALLLAWEHGHDVPPRKLFIIYAVNEFGSLADRFLETVPGAAFRSSVRNAKITAGLRSNLNEVERARFGEIDYIFETTSNRSHFA